MKKVSLEKIVALCKRKGFVYPSAEIYGGLNGIYDFGHLGTLLKQNIRRIWIRSMLDSGKDILLIEGAIIGPRILWEASGHIKNFNDPMVDCLNCKHRYRSDEIDLNKPCPHCGKKKWTKTRLFNMMFKTNLGAAADQTSEVYLRPETAQSIYINFKNALSSNRVKIPFGIAQTGKAFRNEITPKQFLFRMREFEQMEMQWFCREENAEKYFEFWKEKRLDFYDKIGIKKENLRLHEHDKNELAHYAKKAFDIEYHFPFGWKELEGIHNRSNFDLSQHIKYSGKDLAVFDEKSKKSFIPYIIECSIGADRLFLALLADAYTEDQIDGESRIVLKLSPATAPVKAAFFPLTKQQTEAMHKIYMVFKNKGLSVEFDSSGSIGKRYRRQDEIGTPVCFTYDFKSEKDQSVTIRDRDTTKQKRIKIDSIERYIKGTIH